MIKLMKIGFLFLMLFGDTKAFSHEHVAIIGSDDGFGPYKVLRFEVIDAESNMPLENAIITLHIQGERIFSLVTDDKGVGVVLAFNRGEVPSGQLKIVAPEHKFLEMDYDSYDAYENRKRLVIFGMETDWSGTGRPDTENIIRALVHSEYRTLPAGRQPIWFSPDFYEYRFEMTHIDKTINIETGD